MQVVLVMFRGEGERRSFSITRDVTIVGRREDCDFRIPLGEISRKHCRLVKEGEVLKVEDLGSSNGTFHNGERIQAAELMPGDTLQVGSVAFVVQIDGSPIEEELQPRTAGDRKTAYETAPEEGDSGISEVTLSEGNSRSGNGAHDSHGSSNGEFDPMSVLEAGASGALPAISDSIISDDIMAGNSSAGDEAPADQA
jgi:pSer/pThr/pTyr-binding forkhead associated (FHA) protein